MSSTNESYVQVATDGAGKKIDNFTVTLSDGTTTVYRQVAVIADPDFVANVQRVDALGNARVRNDSLTDLLTQILVEMRVQTTILQATLNSRDDVDLLRNQEQLVTLQQTQ